MNVLLIDTFDLYRRVQEKFDAKLDYSIVADLFEPDQAVAYGSTSETNRSFVACLRRLNFTNRFKRPHTFHNTLHCDWNVKMALDAVDLHEPGCTVIFGTCSLQILPIIRWLKQRDVKITIFGVDIPTPLAKAADTVVEITEDLLECD